MISARHPYDNLSQLASDESALDTSGPALQPNGLKQDVQGAHQEYKDECDINFLLRKYDKTGVIPVVQSIEAKYGDFTSAEDYHSIHNRIIAAQSAFMGLPAKIRSRFDNDAALLLDFINDPANKADAVAMGLLASDSPRSGSAVPVSQVPALAASVPVTLSSPLQPPAVSPVV